MKNKKYIHIGLVMIALLISVKFGYGYLTNIYSENEDNINNNEVLSEKKALDFTVYDKDNNKVNLSDYKGKKNVVVNFWASWCPPCKAEMPYFQEATEQYKDDDLEILMVNLTDGNRETKEKANEFLERENYSMNIMYDIDEDAATTYYLNAVPRTLFIDKEGNLKYDHIGMLNNGILNNNILKLLDE